MGRRSKPAGATAIPGGSGRNQTCCLRSKCRATWREPGRRIGAGNYDASPWGRHLAEHAETGRRGGCSRLEQRRAWSMYC